MSIGNVTASRLANRALISGMTPIAWKLYTTLTADDVDETLERAFVSSGRDQASVQHKQGALTGGPRKQIEAFVCSKLHLSRHRYGACAAHNRMPRRQE